MRMSTMVRGAVAAGMLAWVVGAGATVQQLQADQQAEPSLLDQYTFDAGSVSAALLDQEAPANDLVENGTGLAQASSFDGGAQEALTIPNDTGHAIQTSPTAFGNESTVELLLRPTGDTFGEGHIISQLTLGQRFYFAQVNESLKWRRGNDIAGGREVMGGSSGVDFVLNHWYYVALVSTFDDQGNGPGSDDTFTLNAYVQDLTAGGSLVQTLTNVVGDAADGGNAGSSAVNLGRNVASGSTEWFGEIDALAIYTNALDAATIQSHAIEAPVPVLEFTQVDVVDTPALEFTTVPGTTYRLEAAPTPTGTFDDQGLGVDGDGSTMRIIDPTETTGISTSKTYRIRIVGP